MKVSLLIALLRGMTTAIRNVYLKICTCYWRLLFDLLFQELLDVHQQSTFRPPWKLYRIKLLLSELLYSDLIVLIRLAVQNPKQNRNSLKSWDLLEWLFRRLEHLFAVAEDLRIDRVTSVSLDVNILASLGVVFCLPLILILTGQHMVPQLGVEPFDILSGVRDQLLIYFSFLKRYHLLVVRLILQLQQSFSAHHQLLIRSNRLWVHSINVTSTRRNLIFLR